MLTTAEPRSVERSPPSSARVRCHSALWAGGAKVPPHLSGDRGPESQQQATQRHVGEEAAKSVANNLFLRRISLCKHQRTGKSAPRQRSCQIRCQLVKETVKRQPAFRHRKAVERATARVHGWPKMSAEVSFARVPVLPLLQQPASFRCTTIAPPLPSNNLTPPVFLFTTYPKISTGYFFVLPRVNRPSSPFNGNFEPATKPN